MTLEVTVEGQKEISGQIDNITEAARAMVVDSDQGYQDAADFANACLRREKGIIKTFRDPKVKAWEAHKAVCNVENMLLDRVKDAAEIVAGKMKVFHEKREAERLAAEKKEQEIKEAEEAERERIRKEAEQKQRDEEEKARLEAEERDRVHRNKQEVELRKAKKAEEAGNKLKADRILQEQIEADKRRKDEEKRIAAEKLEEEDRDRIRQDREEAEQREREEQDEQVRLAEGPKKAHADGASMRKEWFAEVTDLKALCKAIGQGKAPVSSVQANSKVLNGMAKTLKEELDIPGVVAKSKSVLARRS